MFVAIQGLIVNIRGLRLYARIQKIVFWPGLVLLIFFMILMLFSSHGTFTHNFNNFMSEQLRRPQRLPGDDQRRRHDHGGSNLGDTILASVIAAFLLIFPAFSVQQAGEIKRAGSVRGNLYSMLGSEAFTFIIMALLGAPADRQGRHRLPLLQRQRSTSKGRKTTRCRCRRSSASSSRCSATRRSSPGCC